jgi:hypothetical protein
VKSKSRKGLFCSGEFGVAALMWNQDVIGVDGECFVIGQRLIIILEKAVTINSQKIGM